MATHTSSNAHAYHGNCRGEDRGKFGSDTMLRAVVVKVAVAVAVCVPSSVNIEGETLQVAPAGAPMQLQVTV
jgi:hypothetical protein